MSTGEIIMVIICGVESVATVIGAIVALVALNKKTSVSIQPQPLTVEIIEALHKQFAGRQDFLDHIRDNDKQRGILHRRVDEVITDYNEKFQALPSQIVVLLRNTGAIRS